MGKVSDLEVAAGLDTSTGVNQHLRMETKAMRELLRALVEQTREMASRMADDPDRETVCHFCGTGVPLWESLMVLNLAGVPAHLECPLAALESKLSQAAPEGAFPYAEFSAAVDTRMENLQPLSHCAGVICAAPAPAE